MTRLLILFLLLSFFGRAQELDSTRLKYSDFMQIVMEHHPIARQAKLQSERGSAQLNVARGAFDPKLDGSISQKYFDDKQYYSHIHSGLKIPTWFGLSAQAGYELNDGVYLNPSSRVPDDGLWYAGLSLSVLNGLLIDERRAELKQAKIYSQSADIEGKLILNQLIYDASEAYWSWFSAYHKMKIYENAVQNASFRFESVVNSALLGDRPYIDTVEAKIQLQDRQIGFNQSRTEFLNKKKLLEVFLWQEGFIPLELKDETLPEEQGDIPNSELNPSLSLISDSIIQNHPEMLLYQNKLDMKAVDLQLKRQGILPDVQLKYNLLRDAGDANILAGVSPSNYNWGLSLSYPIFTRKERGTIRLANIELEQLRMDQSTKIQQLEYKIAAALNSWENSSNQVELYRAITQNYETLYNGEFSLFSIGESSLFLLNARERSLIDARLKLIDFVKENQLAEQFVNYQLVRITF